MTITDERWNGWDAVRCSSGDCELIAGISAGPRILSLRYRGGDNLLYEDKTDLRVGDWRIYGGHRFTTAPENDASYYPDNVLCKVTITPSALKITAPQRPDGARLSLLITEAADGEGFDLEHVLEYQGARHWEGALWAITCVPRSARLQAACTTSAVHFWPGTDPANWQVANGRMSVSPGDFRAKAGWHMAFAELAAIQPQGTLLIKSTCAALPAACVDNGSNVEVFVCGDFAELETLNEKRVIAPGSSARHFQQWRLFPFATGIH